MRPHQAGTDPNQAQFRHWGNKGRPKPACPPPQHDRCSVNSPHSHSISLPLGHTQEDASPGVHPMRDALIPHGGSSSPCLDPSNGVTTGSPPTLGHSTPTGPTLHQLKRPPPEPPPAALRPPPELHQSLHQSLHQYLPPPEPHRPLFTPSLLSRSFSDQARGLGADEQLFSAMK